MTKANDAACSVCGEQKNESAFYAGLSTSPNTPKCPKIKCVSRASVARMRQCAPVVFLTGAPLKSMPYDDLRQCVSRFLRQCEMCRKKLFKINNLERLRQCVSRRIYNIYI